ncbi:MAG: NAD(P)H-hydrate dehydratase [Clostridia bacterium]|nr:NAD(P)H-hydrate dehydratase [Clostridia bacterium]
MRLLTCGEMKQVEKHAANYGLSYQRMMENAGAACARNIRTILEQEKTIRRNVAIVCGKGNNGGDGFVVARKLLENNYHVCILLAAGYPSTPEAEVCYKEATDHSIPVLWYDADPQKALQTVKSADVIVDAVFGFSFYGTIRDELKPLLAEMNAASAVKFALDVPSGVYCDSGLCDRSCFVADYTVAISALKPAHVVHPAADCCGDVIIAGIGIPDESFRLVEHAMYTYNTAEVAALFPRRSTRAHKGNFGRLLSICGSRNMPGAACLAAKAALRCGTGLVTAAFPASMYLTMSVKLTETLLLPLQETPQGTLSRACIPTLLERLPEFDAVVIGCGLAVNDDTAEVLRAVLTHAAVPVIVDADGLNLLAKHPEYLQMTRATVVLTPHPKEMSRLTGFAVDEIQSARVETAREYAASHGAFVVLKGANTVVAAPDDPCVYVNASGNNGLAKGGSGDVLAGMLGAFAAQHFPLPQGLCAGVYLHGHCADVLGDRLSKTGMLPTDVVEELAAVFAEFEQ